MPPARRTLSLADKKELLIGAVVRGADDRDQARTCAMRDHPGDWPPGMLEAYIDAMLRTRHDFVRRSIRAAANEAQLLKLAYLYLGRTAVTRFDSATSWPSNGRAVNYDRMFGSFMRPDHAAAGRVIARAATHAQLSPHTAMGRARLQREFRRMQN